MTTQSCQPRESRVCLCRKPACIHETFLDLLDLFCPFREMFRTRSDNTHLPTHIVMCACVRACVRARARVCRKPLFLHADSFKFLNLFCRLWEMIFIRHDNTDLPTHRVTEITFQFRYLSLFFIRGTTRLCFHSRCCLLFLARVCALRWNWSLSWLT